MIGAINLPISFDDSAIRDELANLRLQASALAAAVTGAGNLLADVKPQVTALTASVAALTGDVLATHTQLAQIEGDLAVLREMIPVRKPTFVVSLSVKHKEPA